MLESRQTIIIEKLEKYGNVEVKKLSQELGVTEKTIRQDLIRMENLGLLKRVHGGAVINVKQTSSYFSNNIRTSALPAKEKIARAAFDYLKNTGIEGLSIFLDAGTTTYELSRYLKNLSNLTIITNDLLILSNLSNLGNHLHSTGGTLSNNVNKYFVGVDALEMIHKHNASLCFIGASSLNANIGYMTHTNEDAQIKRAVLERSAISVCLVDHTKFNKNSFVKFADLNQIDVIITDDKTPIDTIKKFEEQNVKVIIAN